MVSGQDKHNVHTAVAAIVLAAGKGTRMKSEKAKVLHPVGGRPMILHVVDAALGVAGNIVVVVGTQADKVKSIVLSHATVDFALQAEQKGTGHAVLCAMPALPENAEHVMILCGDVPLISRETLARLVARHTENGHDITVLAAKVQNPTGYGRLKQKADGNVACIVEESDATAAEKAITTINTGIYIVDRLFLETALLQIKTNNSQSEMYLTDIVEIAVDSGRRVGLMICRDNREVIGINSPKDLQSVESLISSQ